MPASKSVCLGLVQTSGLQMQVAAMLSMQFQPPGHIPCTRLQQHRNIYGTAADSHSEALSSCTLDVARLSCACRLWQDWSQRRQMLSYSCSGRQPASAMVPVLSRWVGGGGGGGGGELLLSLDRCGALS